MQIHVSKLLLVCTVAGIAATAGLVVAAYMDASRPAPPPRPEGGMPPPPPPPSEMFMISLALFVLAWLAVLVVLSRDQILHRIAALRGGEGAELLAERVTAMMREYGEHRETEGYVNGMRTAMAPDAEVRQLRGVPPSARLTP